MKELISESITKLADEIIREQMPTLTATDVRNMRTQGPELLKKIKIRVEKKKDPFKKFDKDDKKLLLAYVVYLRQNLTTEEKDIPNSEDAARLLHEEIFENEDKMEKELKKQLSKIGINIED